jgi:hypothetical protein
MRKQQETQKSPGLTPFWATLVRAATQPSLAALLGTLFVVLFLFLTCAVVITPQSLSSVDSRYLLAHDRDTFADTTHLCMRMRYSPPQRLAVAILGSSDTRAATTDPREMEQVLTQRLGRWTPVYDLAVPSVGVPEIAAMADFLGDGFNGVVVISMIPGRLARGKDWLEKSFKSPRLGLGSIVFDEEVRLAGVDVPARTGIYFFDHYRFLVARRHALVHLMTGPAPNFVRYAFPDGETLSGKEWNRMVEQVQATLETYYDNRESSLAVVSRTVARLRQRGQVDVVILEAPLHPELVGLVYPPQLLADHRARLERFSRDHDVHYWNLQAEAKLGTDDFRDYCHLRSPEARKRYTKAFVKRLTAVLTPFLAMERK